MGKTSKTHDLLKVIRMQAATLHFRVAQHAQQKMVEDDYAMDDVLGALAQASILEDYPSHRRGACCLLGGSTRSGRPIHIVCTTANPVLIIITVYEPKPPKWTTPTERRAQS